jgi:hypothetical protein
MHHASDVNQPIRSDGFVGQATAVRYDARMPRLACWSCGRQIYTVAPLESLFAEERRCPRCGAYLSTERRETDRRETIRRQNPKDDPGPPGGVERRLGDRRNTRRRKRAAGDTARSPDEGWQD